MGQVTSKRSYKPGSPQDSELPSSPVPDPDPHNGQPNGRGGVQLLHRTGHDDVKGSSPSGDASLASPAKSSADKKKTKKRFFFSLKKTGSGKRARKSRQANGAPRPASCLVEMPGQPSFSPAGNQAEAARPKSLIFDEPSSLSEEQDVDTVSLSDDDSKNKKKKRGGNSQDNTLPSSSATSPGPAASASSSSSFFFKRDKKKNGSQKKSKKGKGKEVKPKAEKKGKEKPKPKSEKAEEKREEMAAEKADEKPERKTGSRVLEAPSASATATPTFEQPAALPMEAEPKFGEAKRMTEILQAPVVPEYKAISAETDMLKNEPKMKPEESSSSSSDEECSNDEHDRKKGKKPKRKQSSEKEQPQKLTLQVEIAVPEVEKEHAKPEDKAVDCSSSSSDEEDNCKKDEKLQNSSHAKPVEEPESDKIPLQRDTKRGVEEKVEAEPSKSVVEMVEAIFQEVDHAHTVESEGHTEIGAEPPEPHDFAKYQLSSLSTRQDLVEELVHEPSQPGDFSKYNLYSMSLRNKSDVDLFQQQIGDVTHKEPSQPTIEGQSEELQTPKTEDKYDGEIFKVKTEDVSKKELFKLTVDDESGEESSSSSSESEDDKPEQAKIEPQAKFDLAVQQFFQIEKALPELHMQNGEPSIKTPQASLSCVEPFEPHTKTEDLPLGEFKGHEEVAERTKNKAAGHVKASVEVAAAAPKVSVPDKPRAEQPFESLAQSSSPAELKLSEKERKAGQKRLEKERKKMLKEQQKREAKEKKQKEKEEKDRKLKEVKARLSASVNTTIEVKAEDKQWTKPKVAAIEPELNTSVQAEPPRRPRSSSAGGVPFAGPPVHVEAELATPSTPYPLPLSSSEGKSTFDEIPMKVQAEATTPTLIDVNFESNRMDQTKEGMGFLGSSVQDIICNLERNVIQNDEGLEDTEILITESRPEIKEEEIVARANHTVTHSIPRTLDLEMAVPDTKPIDLDQTASAVQIVLTRELEPLPETAAECPPELPVSPYPEEDDWTTSSPCSSSSALPPGLVHRQQSLEVARSPPWPELGDRNRSHVLRRIELGPRLRTAIQRKSVGSEEGEKGVFRHVQVCNLTPPPRKQGVRKPLEQAWGPYPSRFLSSAFTSLPSLPTAAAEEEVRKRAAEEPFTATRTQRAESAAPSLLLGLEGPSFVSAKENQKKNAEDGPAAVGVGLTVAIPAAEQVAHSLAADAESGSSAAKPGAIAGLGGQVTVVDQDEVPMADDLSDAVAQHEPGEQGQKSLPSASADALHRLAADILEQAQRDDDVARKNTSQTVVFGQSSAFVGLATENDPVSDNHSFKHEVVSCGAELASNNGDKLELETLPSWKQSQSQCDLGEEQSLFQTSSTDSDAIAVAVECQESDVASDAPLTKKLQSEVLEKLGKEKDTVKESSKVGCDSSHDSDSSSEDESSDKKSVEGIKDDVADHSVKEKKAESQPVEEQALGRTDEGQADKVESETELENESVNQPASEKGGSGYQQQTLKKRSHSSCSSDSDDGNKHQDGDQRLNGYEAEKNRSASSEGSSSDSEREESPGDTEKEKGPGQTKKEKSTGHKEKAPESHQSTAPDNGTVAVVSVGADDGLTSRCQGLSPSNETIDAYLSLQEGGGDHSSPNNVNGHCKGSVTLEANNNICGDSHVTQIGTNGSAHY